MLCFPKTTEFDKKIPKQKFYEKIEISPALKRVFIDQIKLIYWRNKLAASTLNLTAGKNVTEIEVFEICLRQPRLDEAVLRQIDREIPYHILFVLSFDGKYQAWIGYKEAASGAKAFKVTRYYHTDWMSEDKLLFAIEGLNMDAVYESLVRQIAVTALEAAASGESLKETIERGKQRLLLQKQIAALENKIRKEKQLNRRMEMNAELKALKKNLDMI